jgi:hypothetical protein
LRTRRPSLGTAPIAGRSLVTATVDPLRWRHEAKLDDTLQGGLERSIAGQPGEPHQTLARSLALSAEHLARRLIALQASDHGQLQFAMGLAGQNSRFQVRLHTQKRRRLLVVTLAHGVLPDEIASPDTRCRLVLPKQSRGAISRSTYSVLSSAKA